MLGKLRNLVLLAALVWGLGTWGYRQATAMKLQRSLQEPLGAGAVVGDLKLSKWYLGTDVRFGEATVEVPEGRSRARGFEAAHIPVSFQVEGRWWPSRVIHHGVRRAPIAAADPMAPRASTFQKPKPPITPARTKP
jgi:hypothetical protein